MRRSRVHVLGASGSGTTSLGRALADRWSVPHADTDDYFWHPTTPPFTAKRPISERVALMREMFVDREAWVLSGSLVGWGDEIVARCDAMVLVTLEPGERMRRLLAREALRGHGTDVDREAQRQFLEWARGYDDPAFAGRSLAGHQGWLRRLGKPVLHLDSARPVAELVEAVESWDPEGDPAPEWMAEGR